MTISAGRWTDSSVALAPVLGGKGKVPEIEKELAPFQARPHWGKLFTMSPQQLHASYKKLPEFIALTKKFDPNGKFRNDFLNTNIFS